MFVAIVLDTAKYFTYIIGTQMGIEAGLTGNTLQQLFFIILATKTETNQV